MTLDPGTSIFLVDDDDAFRVRLAQALKDRGLSVKDTGDGATALRWAEQDPPEAAVVDLRMPAMNGLDVVRGLLRIEPHTRVIVLTGYGSVPTAVEAVRAGAAHYLQKPVSVAALVSALEGESPASSSEDVPDVSLARAEWEHINRVLADCDGNVSEASRRLKIHRRSLQRKLQKVPPKS